MRRSVTAFTLGMIGSLICFVWGILGAFCGDILAITGVAPQVTRLIAVFGWLCFFGSWLGIAGAGLTLKNARIGALCLLISSVLCGALLVDVVVETIKGNIISPAICVLLLFSLAIMVVAVVFGFLARKVKKPRYANDVKDDYQGPDASKNLYHYNRNNIDNAQNSDETAKDKIISNSEDKTE